MLWGNPMASPKRFLIIRYFRWAFGAVGALSAVFFLLLHRQHSIHMMKDCGPRSLRLLATRLGANPDNSPFLSRLENNNGVTSFSDLQDAASEMGLVAVGMRMDMATLKRQKPVGILHVYGSHFVALVGYKENDLIIADPTPNGKMSIHYWPYNHLPDVWDGSILVVRKRP